MGFQGIPGHEFVGIVEKCSDEKLIGKRVVGEINIGYSKSQIYNNKYLLSSSSGIEDSFPIPISLKFFISLTFLK